MSDETKTPAPDKAPGPHDSAAGAAKREHWLRRPETIRKLWIIGICTLIVVTLFDFALVKKAKFGIDATFGFYSWYGLVTCAIMVFFAKLLGVFIKRSDTYYEPSPDELAQGREPR